MESAINRIKRLVQRGDVQPVRSSPVAPAAELLVEDPGTEPWRERQSDDYGTDRQPTCSPSPEGGMPRVRSYAKPKEEQASDKLHLCLRLGTTAWRQRTLPPGCTQPPHAQIAAVP